jgi:hypothetical protein
MTMPKIRNDIFLEFVILNIVVTPVVKIIDFTRSQKDTGLKSKSSDLDTGLESKSADLGTWWWLTRQVQTRPKSYDLDSSPVLSTTTS